MQMHTHISRVSVCVCMFAQKYAFIRLRVHANAKMSTIIAAAVATAAVCCIAFTHTHHLRVFIATTGDMHKWNSLEFVRVLWAPPVRNFSNNFFCENKNFHSLLSLCCHQATKKPLHATCLHKYIYTHLHIYYKWCIATFVAVIAITTICT